MNNISQNKGVGPGNPARKGGYVELAFPKRKGQKKRMKHKRSILQKDGSYCYLCAMLAGDYAKRSNLEKHHIFEGTANRTISEREGMTVMLCREHHRESKQAAHRNKEIDILLKTAAQQEYEKTHSREDFRKTFGRSWI